MKFAPRNKIHLKELINQEIEKNGIKCDLNHIDVSGIIDMSYLFQHSNFNGDISKWNVSNVMDMSYMFSNSEFDGDISQWDVKMLGSINGMFLNSQFKGDLSNWKPYGLFGVMSDEFKVLVPYWAYYKYPEDREAAINAYHEKLKLSNELGQELSENKISEKKMKI